MPMVSSPSPSTRVLLVRHGQSEWNAVGRWQGQADSALSDLGRQQAREAADAVGAVDAVWASDLVRAVETATIIADRIGVGPVVVDPDLRERDAGEFSGLTRAEIAERFPGYLEERRRPPGWESDEHLLARALRGLHRIASEVPGGDVLVVTHGGLVYAVEAHLGLGHERLANVEGRWVEVALRGAVGNGARDGAPAVDLRVGDRIRLSAPEDTTVPGQI